MLEHRLFTTARLIVLIAMAVLLVAFSAGAVYFLVNVVYPNTHIMPSYLTAARKSGGTSIDAASPESSTEHTLAQVTLPPLVSKEFEVSNRDVLAGWIEILDPEQRQDFVDNMSETIEYAQKNHEDVTDLINSYKKLKFEKLKDQKERAPNTFMMLGLLISTLITFVLLTLILVTLAVERNTRLRSAL